MFVLETLSAIETILAQDSLSLADEQRIADLLTQRCDDMLTLSHNAIRCSLRELIIDCDCSDDYNVVVDDYRRNAYKTISECINRICEVFSIDASLIFTNRTIESLQNTDI